MKPPMNTEPATKNRRDAERAENPSLGAHASSVLGLWHAGCVRFQERQRTRREIWKVNDK